MGPLPSNAQAAVVGERSAPTPLGQGNDDAPRGRWFELKRLAGIPLLGRWSGQSKKTRERGRERRVVEVGGSSKGVGEEEKGRNRRRKEKTKTK